ncbi:uncharacterized protein TM35_000681090 [Trypanosoma theileri]|uniref:Uncharacterized protein n=1 Tax=Trypanosoma theileri TaxID=67003 RepID=A0A1X0NFP5_9TRYP|nr:uncharacterized protein TM35_000681090 [Trypanosoma theileri]ORC83477.1 hypothetical protein TM35_000681090 [Trypanosoma theileri]
MSSVWVATDVSASTGSAAGKTGDRGGPGPKGSCPSAGEGNEVTCPSESADTSCSHDSNDGGTCTQTSGKGQKPNVRSAAPGPAGERGEQGPPPPATDPHDPQGERSLPGQVSVVSSSSGLDLGGQAAETLRDQHTGNGLNDRTSVGSVSKGKKADTDKNEQEQDEHLRNTANVEQRPPAGDSTKADTSVSQTDASSITPSRGETAGGSHSEDPSAPTPQNTGNTPSNSSTVDNAVSSDAAKDLSNAATSSAESESTRNQNGEGAGGTESTTNTTTTTTTTLPPEPANNKKGYADSSSSISSSVWVRVPLLIVVTLACILVC